MFKQPHIASYLSKIRETVMQRQKMDGGVACVTYRGEVARDVIFAISIFMVGNYALAASAYRAAIFSGYQLPVMSSQVYRIGNPVSIPFLTDRFSLRLVATFSGACFVGARKNLLTNRATFGRFATAPIRVGFTKALKSLPPRIIDPLPSRSAFTTAKSGSSMANSRWWRFKYGFADFTGDKDAATALSVLQSGNHRNQG